jgi:hypothetical protein
MSLLSRLAEPKDIVEGGFTHIPEVAECFEDGRRRLAPEVRITANQPPQSILLDLLEGLEWTRESGRVVG